MMGSDSKYHQQCHLKRIYISSAYSASRVEMRNAVSFMTNSRVCLIPHVIRIVMGIYILERRYLNSVAHVICFAWLVIVIEEMPEGMWITASHHCKPLLRSGLKTYYVMWSTRNANCIRIVRDSPFHANVQINHDFYAE